jgi:hypothetical protein
VKFLSDWLHCWHERGFQTSKDRTDGDHSDMQDADYRCSDSEDIDEGLKNVLLVTGPVGVYPELFCLNCTLRLFYLNLDCFSGFCT